jgi:hypothetical protein
VRADGFRARSDANGGVVNDTLTWLLIGLAALGLLLLGSPCSRTVCYEDATEVGVSDEAGFLYSQTAGRGSLVETADGTYELTLGEISPTTVVFSDRPARDAFTIRTSEFAATFGDTFGTEHPNAELSYEGLGGAFVGSAIFVLSEPAYDAGAASITYRAEHIPMEGAEDVELPEAFGDASLFIDDSSPSLLLSGTVYDNDGEPLLGVLVTAESPSSTTPITALTGPNGTFSLTVPNATSADLSFELEAFSTAVRSVRHSTDDLSITLQIVPGE